MNIKYVEEGNMCLGGRRGEEGRRVEGVGCLFLLQLRKYRGFVVAVKKARSELCFRF